MYLIQVGILPFFELPELSHFVRLKKEPEQGKAK